MSAPRVSVIIIFRDEERFLPEAIDSVLGQAGPEWELLLVDDGSTDGSTTLAREYARQQPTRISYLEHEGHANRGMSATRNLGLARARGEFVAFLDADDVWLPGKLAEQVDIATRHPQVALVYGRTLIWNSWDPGAQQVGQDFFYDLGVVADAVIEPPGLAALLIDNKAQSPTTCNAMMRLDCLRSAGGFEDSFTGMFEDQAAFLRLTLKFPAYVSSRSWAKYRQRQDSCTSRTEMTGQTEAAYLRYLDWAEAQVRSCGRNPQPLLAALERKRWEIRHPALSAASRWFLHAAFMLKSAARCLLGRLGFAASRDATE
jgi:glycosyltransferase involved in cell wall biosynthesis